MLEVSQVAEIKRLHAQGESIRSLAARFDISRNTVRSYVRGDRVPGTYTVSTSRPKPAADEIRGRIVELLEAEREKELPRSQRRRQENAAAIGRSSRRSGRLSPSALTPGDILGAEPLLEELEGRRKLLQMAVEPRFHERPDDPCLLGRAERLSLQVDQRKERAAQDQLGQAAGGGRRPVLVGETAVVPERQGHQVGLILVRQSVEERAGVDAGRGRAVLSTLEDQNWHVKTTGRLDRLP